MRSVDGTDAAFGKMAVFTICVLVYVEGEVVLCRLFDVAAVESNVEHSVDNFMKISRFDSID